MSEDTKTKVRIKLEKDMISKCDMEQMPLKDRISGDYSQGSNFVIFLPEA